MAHHEFYRYEKRMYFYIFYFYSASRKKCRFLEKILIAKCRAKTFLEEVFCKFVSFWCEFSNITRTRSFSFVIDVCNSLCLGEFHQLTFIKSINKTTLFVSCGFYLPYLTKIVAHKNIHLISLCQRKFES